MKPPLIAITGPTATGKSSFAISLAKTLDGEIISADSAQIYKDLLILTARLTEEEMEGIPHHLMGFLDLSQDFSLAQYQEAAYKAIEDILSRGKIPILAGGTGLYIKAVLEDYHLPEAPPDEDFRMQMNKRAEEEGNEVLYNELLSIDPEAAARIHPNNVRRVIRALEVIRYTGKTFSSLYEKGKEHPLNIEPYGYCLDYPREVLYERINRRVDMMFEKGAMDEIEGLLKNGYRERLLKLKILGCPEVMSILDGKCTFQEGSELLKRNTRRYAKKQWTWFRSDKLLEWLHLNEKEEKAEIERICVLIKAK